MPVPPLPPVIALSPQRIADLVQPYLGHVATEDIPPNLYDRLQQYLELLLRWNARTNLTAIREPEEIVRRHFGESLFAGVCVKPLLAPEATLLDFGSGAGFPGIPMQLLLPNLRVTLAESQGKKAAFLREAVRTLRLSTEVLAHRVEALPAGRRFHCVALRAVDSMEAAIAEARRRTSAGGLLAVLAGETVPGEEAAEQRLPIPQSARTFLHLFRERGE